jgi:phosphomannomutase
MLKFGTEGWRGVIAEEFTYANLERVAHAHADALLEQNERCVVIGFDTRFQSEAFAVHTANIFLERGLEVLVASAALPTPALCFAVRHFGADQGVMITASHNPARYNGYKIKSRDGAPLPEEAVRVVERHLERYPVGEDRARSGRVPRFDIRAAYFDALGAQVDLERLASLRGVSVIHDAMGGAASGWLRAFLERHEVPLELAEVRPQGNPDFYGVNPEPIPANLWSWQAYRRAAPNAVVTLLHDGDGDRLAAVTKNGYFGPQRIYPVLLEHVLERGAGGPGGGGGSGGSSGGGAVVKTVSTSSLVASVAERAGARVVETPVGFKYIAPHALNDASFVMGGEESGGFAFRGHLPDRDGVLGALLLLEAMARGGDLDAQYASIAARHGGALHYDRVDLHVPALNAAQLYARLRVQTHFAGLRVAQVNALDGTKLHFEDGSWLLFRASGTEPLLRLYSEALDETRVAANLEAARAFALEDHRVVVSAP